jgi:hypothetical protein
MCESLDYAKKFIEVIFEDYQEDLKRMTHNKPVMFIILNNTEDTYYVKLKYLDEIETSQKFKQEVRLFQLNQEPKQNQRIIAYYIEPFNVEGVCCWKL